MKPRRSILSREFDYVPAAKTDLKKTFARIRRDLREADRKQAELNQRAISALDASTARRVAGPSPGGAAGCVEAIPISTRRKA